ncbi:MAG: thioredoxin domain-containing protein, partial [Chloroflexi bacterium]|nr:thioredoxin domain-containing protein [Chloroflexota bacterium]
VRALEMVEHTLQKMAYGGIYDQVGGGFHRYSTDAYWLVPPFEKKLFENALLARLYLHPWQIKGNALYRPIPEETLDYALREMTDPAGGFYSAQDADSEGVEGKFFVWTPDELRPLLGDDADLIMGYYGVTDRGNFEGSNILNIPRPPDEFADQRGISEDSLFDAIARARSTLLEVRERRIHPLLDDKVLTAWNGLMLRAFAEAGAALDRSDYLDAARHNAAFLLDTMRDSNGRILRTWRGGEAKLLGYLEDYACLADGLVSLHEATLEPRWIQEAVTVADGMVSLFWDDPVGGFYDTGSDHEQLVIRPRDVFDNAQPCGGSVASDVLLRLGVITGNDDFSSRGATPLRSMQQLFGRAPSATGHWLGALDFYVSLPREIVIVGPVDSDATQSMLREVNFRFMPNKVAVGMNDPANPPLKDSPLLEQRTMQDGQPTAYVCENYACQLPVTDAAALAAQLDR